MPDSTLLIVGAPMFNQDHDYLEKLKRTITKLKIEGKVKFLGLRNDVPAVMQAIDALVVNSKSEALCCRDRSNGVRNARDRHRCRRNSRNH